MFGQTGPSQSADVEALRAEISEKVDRLESEIQVLKAQIAALGIRETALARQQAAPVLQSGDAQSTADRYRSPIKPEPSKPEVTSRESDFDPGESVNQGSPLEHGPLTFRLGALSVTPGGFLALESVFRTKAFGADLNTPYAQTPFSGAGLAHQTEWTPSGRQSRLSLLLQGRTRWGKVTGYYEGDFLQAGSNTNSIQTSSYVLRQRQVFFSLQAPRRWTISGGQMWTLATENARGVDPRGESLPLVIDGAQSVGFTWGRWAGLRLGKKISNTASLAMSLEQPQIVFSAANAPQNFFFGTPGSGAGAFNPDFNYSVHSVPDFIVKSTFDLKRNGHYELGLIGRVFRDRYYPDNRPPLNDTKAAGGIFGSARVPVGSRLELGAKLVAGRGLGRYGSSTLPDVTVKPDGTLAPLQNAQLFFRAELRAAKRVDLFSYNGLEYAGRASYSTSGGVEVGYGIRNGDNSGCLIESPPTSNSGYNPSTPANCLGANRVISEWSGGLRYSLYEGSVGRIQLTTVYGYVTRDAWSGIGGAPHANNHLVYSGVRFILP